MDEYDKIYRRKLRISAVAHLAAVALAFGLNFIQGCFSGKKIETSYDEIEFTVPMPAGAVGVPEPEPEPIPTTPPQIAAPVPEPQPRRAIEVSTVTRNVTATPATTTRPPVTVPPVARPTFDSRLSEAEVNRLLAMGATPSDRLRIPASETQRCMAIIEKALFSAWKRPSAEHDTGRGTEINIVIGTSGTILTSKITRGSGNKTFDESVIDAVNSTARFTGLTPDFIKQYEKGVIIKFELK